MGFKEMLQLIFLFSFVLIGYGVEGGRNSSSKVAVKTIKAEYGQIFDCVDINKQPAFDHPLLRNHKIKMSPSSLPKVIEVKEHSSIAVSLGIELMDGGCPLGTVPIRRIEKEVLTRAKSATNFGKRYSSNAETLSNDQPNNRFATQMSYKGKFYGTRADLNVWEPTVIGNQTSYTYMAVTDVLQVGILVGWAVDHKIYNDFRPHLSTTWKNGKTECEDILCPGFVQVSPDIPLGAAFKTISSYNGTQYSLILAVYKDPVTKDWWLLFGNDNKKVGYWPNALFSSTFTDHATIVQWGGGVTNAGIEPWPQMGSGHFADEGFKHASYVGQMKYILENGDTQDVDHYRLSSAVDAPKCYTLKPIDSKSYPTVHSFFFGGPGGNC
ncbi:protein neprosin-like [Tasmannia lanceolata]|uniref:protein neprosin-like n=1 Tax=Tasmannia lanceolata TaxID=3420 RepID=UPI0040629E67